MIQGKIFFEMEIIDNIHCVFEGHIDVMYDDEVGFSIGTWLTLPWRVTSYEDENRVL